MFDPITDSINKRYTISIETNSSKNKGIAVYTSVSDNYEGDSKIDNIVSSNDALMKVFYNDVKRTKDGLRIKEIADSNEDIFIASSVKQLQNDKEILHAMEASYNKNQAFVTKKQKISVSNTQVNSNERIMNLKEYGNGSLFFQTKLSSKRLIIVNEYNDGNWVAYQDGKRIPVKKANYLFRGIEVEKGIHDIKLVYQPKKMYFLILFSILGVLILFAMIVFEIKSKNKSGSNIL